MSDSQTASVGANSTAVKPRDVVAFRTSLNANQCLVGVVASKPSAPQPDGTTSVLVQPRPLILVPPQPPQNKKVKAVRLTGQLVDRADSAVAPLAVTPIPSVSVSEAPVPAKDASTSAVVTAEELREMQAQRLSLQSDLDTSKARVSEIDNLLLQNALAKQRQQKADKVRQGSRQGNRRGGAGAAAVACRPAHCQVCRLGQPAAAHPPHLVAVSGRPD